MFKNILIAAGLLLTLCAHAQQHAITGTVRDTEEERPLAGATVQIANTDRISVTNESGDFQIEGLSAGTYTVITRHVGFETKEQTVQLNASVQLTIDLTPSVEMTEEVVVYSTRANDKTPTTFTHVNKERIEQQNFGQDIPMLLNWTPSMVTTSDAGAGIGYTGLRIRGSDASRTNVTINGIALNDSESQGVFWVNTPDLASSIQSIQIQRGVGTSTNGAGAFGATVSVLTNVLSKDPYAEAIASFGSYNAQRYTFKGGTGLINDRWAFDGRVSQITSDGYIERAASDLSSYYLSGGYYGKSTIVKAIVFGGHEQTYQAWNGIDEETLKINRRFNYSGAIYDEDGNIVRYYDNEVDDYRQDHYQLHISQQLGGYWNANVAFHYTNGRGFFEQYLQDAPFEDFGLPNVSIGNATIESTDAIVRRWLDNDYYGATFSANYAREKSAITLGGAISNFDNARHFGEIMWAEIGLNSPIRHVYYDGESRKTDFNIYGKWNYEITGRLSSFLDVQYRSVNYRTAGIDNDQSVYAVDDEFHFFNPKIGLSYSVDDNSVVYTSYAVANREPNRTDYLDGSGHPKNERMGDLELGFRKTEQAFAFEVNYYLMHYQDQLVLTGELNDVGAPIRANIGKSYRTGLELAGSVNVSDKINWNGNVTWSVNKNQDFAIFDQNNNVASRNTTIILSPSWVAGSQLTWNAFKGFRASLLSKYVGKQFLDNTENDAVALKDYLINDLRLSYQFKIKTLSTMELSFLVNNLFDVAYSSNGYGYAGTPYFYPQAGINFLGMISVKI